MHLRLLTCTLLVACCSAFGSTVGELPACATNTLAYYQSTYSLGNGAGCKVGSLGYSKFYFEELAATNGALDTLNITASDLMIVPVAATNSFNILPVDLSDFNRAISIPERYLIRYFVDPPPIIAGDELTLDPPVGSIYATKWGCTDSDFTVSPTSIENKLLQTGLANYSASTFACGPNSTTPYILKTDGVAATQPGVSDFVLFNTPASTLSVRLVLDFQPGTITRFDGILNPVETTIPEPGANLMIAGGLTLFGLVARKRMRR